MMTPKMTTQLIQLIGYEVEITQKNRTPGHLSTMRATLLSYHAQNDSMLLLFETGDRVVVNTEGENFTIKRAKERGSDG